MEARRPERLVGVDVADAGDERLVEEERLQAALARSQPAPEVAEGERVVERFGAGSGEDRRAAGFVNGLTGGRDRRCRRRSARTCGCRGSAARVRRRSATTRRTYGSSGDDAGTTKSCPVILRWIVMTAPPDSPITSCLPRRPTDSIRRPARAAPTDSGAWVRRVLAHDAVASRIVAPRTRPRRSRATVSTSGSSGIARASGRLARWSTSRLQRAPPAPRPAGRSASSIPSRRRP